MLRDDLGEKKLLQKGLHFGMWASIHLRNIALKLFFHWVSHRCKKGTQVGKKDVSCIHNISKTKQTSVQKLLNIA